MKVALIFNPFKYKVHEENLKIVQKYFGLFPPLSLSWVASIAEKAGHEVILVDARTLRLTKEEVLVKLKKFKPDILGFMMTTYMYRDTLRNVVMYGLLKMEQIHLLVQNSQVVNWLSILDLTGFQEIQVF